MEEQLRDLIRLLPADAQELLKQQPAVAVSIVVVLATILLFVLLRLLLGSKGGSIVVIAGPCNAGKSCLFYQLKDGTVHNGMVASMEENEGSCQVKDDKGRARGQVKLVDVPGHPRLRHKLEQHLRDAKAVVLVVDAAEITPQRVEAAEELFEVLTAPSVSRRRVPILLACNKLDLTTQAHSVDFIKRTIEKQLDGMRKTRTALSPETASKVGGALGKADKPLVLGQLRSPISTASISALTGDVAEVHQFLRAFC